MRSALLPFALVPTIASADVPNVSADIAPVASLVSMVMGDLGAPTLLLAQGISPHDAAMRPSQAQALQDSDIVVWIGSGLTPFLDDSIPKLAPDATSIILLELDAPEAIEGGHDHSHGAHEDEHADEHDEHDDEHDEHDDHDDHDDEHDDKEEESHNIDAHAWLDPINAVAWLDEIVLHLSETDPRKRSDLCGKRIRGQGRFDRVERPIGRDTGACSGRPVHHIPRRVYLLHQPLRPV